MKIVIFILFLVVYLVINISCLGFFFLMLGLLIFSILVVCFVIFILDIGFLFFVWDIIWMVGFGL